MTKRMNASDLMMQEVINFGGCLFTRVRLLGELHKRNFSTQDIDLYVFGPGLLCEIDLTNTFNNTPNEAPAWFWPAVEEARKS